MRSNGRSQPSGQTMPLFAILVPGMLALMALGLDGAQIFLERREAQGAADLAALAGVLSLPDSPSTAVADAKAVGAAHGFQLSQVVPVTPFDGDDERIEVTVNSSVTTWFMPILGIFGIGDYSSVDVSARAVAQGQWTGGATDSFAIFALEGCPSLEKSVDISGSDSFFVGRVHSNSDVYISGSNMAVTGSTTSVCGDGYPSFHDGGDGNTFDPEPTLDTHQADPIGLAITDWTCDFLAPATGIWDLSSDGVWWVGGSKDSKTLRAGTYCSRGSNGGIKLGDSDIRIEDVVSGSGGVTFVAQWTIEVSGSNFDLHPHEHDALFVSYGETDVAIKVSGSGGDWLGLMYAPNGTAEVSGQANINISGGIVAERVKLNGSNANINDGAGEPAPPEQLIALIE